ncbi:uncharacterized protein HaLaN_10354, partial [Haematococcus lacustris]
MMPGLLEGQEKMSKSDPNSAIFMEDSDMDVNAKIKKAYCPPQVVEGNPCLEYIRHITFPWFNKFEAPAGLACCLLPPGDLKPALARALNQILQPVRDHFDSNPEAKELLKKVRSYKTTK